MVWHGGRRTYSAHLLVNAGMRDAVAAALAQASRWRGPGAAISEGRGAHAGHGRAN